MIPTRHATQTTTLTLKMSQPLSESTVQNTSVRSSRWFITVNGPWAASFYTAVAITRGIATDHSADDSVQRYLSGWNAAGSIEAYFKQSDMAIVWELAPSTNHYHLHIALHCQNKLSRRQLMELIGPCDARIMAGRPHQAHQYLLKTGNLVLYLGNQDYWREPAARAPTSTDWRSVMAKALTCDSYNEFIRKYVTCDDPDEDCLKASLNRASWIMQLINSKTTPKKSTTFRKTQWQASLLAIAHLPPENSHRKIVNVWSTESGTGKSTLADILRNDQIRVFVFPGNLKMHDAIYMYSKEPVVVVDLARHASIENSGVYEVLEILSDQRVCSSGKYNGKSVRWLAHVFVLSNQKLDPSRLPGRIDFIEAKPLDQETLEDVTVTLSFDMN